jgi:hypothetical protein
MTEDRDRMPSTRRVGSRWRLSLRLIAGARFAERAEPPRFGAGSERRLEAKLAFLCKITRPATQKRLRYEVGAQLPRPGAFLCGSG